MNKNMCTIKYIRLPPGDMKFVGTNRKMIEKLPLAVNWGLPLLIKLLLRK